MCAAFFRRSATLAAGKLFDGVKRPGDKWEDKWEQRRARRLGKPPPSSKSGDTGKSSGAAEGYAELEEMWPAPKYKSCALVGNSHRMLLDSEQGALINRHDTVMRLNNAPTLGYEAFVGNYTSHRLINNKWARP